MTDLGNATLRWAARRAAAGGCAAAAAGARSAPASSSAATAGTTGAAASTASSAGSSPRNITATNRLYSVWCPSYFHFPIIVPRLRGYSQHQWLITISEFWNDLSHWIYSLLFIIFLYGNIKVCKGKLKINLETLFDHLFLCWLYLYFLFLVTN